MTAVERADLDAVLAADLVILDEPDVVVETIARATDARSQTNY